MFVNSHFWGANLMTKIYTVVFFQMGSLFAPTVEWGGGGDMSVVIGCHANTTKDAIKTSLYHVISR